MIDLWAWCLKRRTFLVTSYLRNPEYNWGQPFQVRGRQTRLDPESDSVQDSQLTLGTHAGGPLCNKDYHTAFPIPQLEARSPGTFTQVLGALPPPPPPPPPFVLDREVHKETRTTIVLVTHLWSPDPLSRLVAWLVSGNTTGHQETLPGIRSFRELH